MSTKASVPPFLAEDSGSAQVWFDNILKIKEFMKWNDEQTNIFGQLALVNKASMWVECLTLNNSRALDEFKNAFLQCFDKVQSVLEAQCLISNLRKSVTRMCKTFSRVSLPVSCFHSRSLFSSC